MFWPIRLISIVIVVALCFGIELFARGGGDLLSRLVFLAGLYVTLSVSLNLINGITGQFSMGHAAFYMVGAYCSGFLLKIAKLGEGLPGPLQMALMMFFGAIGAALAGLIVGLPSLRLKGDYLAVVTLGFGEILRIIAQNTEQIGGSYGLDQIPKHQYIWLAWLLAFTCIAICRNLLKTAHGLPFLAVREDEIASSAMGVNVTMVKVTAFVLGSALAGAAGALLAGFETFISPTTFPMELSFTILTMVVLGGTGSITGSALAAVVLFYLPEKLRDMQDVTGAQLTATIIAVIAVVVALRALGEKFHGPKLYKAGFMVGSIVAGIVLAMILGPILSAVPNLKNNSFEASKLRMVIFAGTLVILMLLRPQGVFAHHEFSWSWVKKLFGKRDVPTTAVSS